MTCHSGGSGRRDSFTLIELLIVIAIIAVLAVVVVLTLNPAELLKQARDSNRLSDLQTLNKAISIYETDTLGQGSLGIASTTYVSIPDPNATTTAGTNCSGMGLPTLPSGWTYKCAASSTYRKVDGTGWIPVNFTQVSSGPPIGQLPVDPTNTTSTRLYYAYTPGGSWELAAAMEAAKNKMGGAGDKVSADGGQNAGLYEIGSNLALLPIDYSDTALIGWWKFDEGTGVSTADGSGSSRTGTLNNGVSWLTAGCKRNNCLSFDGVDDNVSFSGVNQNTFTRIAWIYPTNILNCNSGEGRCAWMYLYSEIGNTNRLEQYNDGWSGGWISGGTINLNTWQQVAVTYDGSTAALYVNGSQVASATRMLTTGNLASGIIGANSVNNRPFTGRIDDVRLYSRGLSAAEISAIYNAQK